MFDQAKPAFFQERTFERARTLAMSSVIGLGRKTVTGMLCTSAQQFTDWSAAYRLFEQQRFNTKALFTPIRREVVARIGPQEPLVVLMDDTLMRKRGKKVHGTGWKRDPLGPAFCSNFVWGQRFLQLSAALPDDALPGRARGIPINLTHAPSAAKPGKRACEQNWREYKEQQKCLRVSSVGASQLRQLREQLDQEDPGRKLIISVDGGFTNRTVFRDLPDNTIAIGRIRKDARLFLPPSKDVTPGRGRRRWYGQQLPTPEQMRRDDSIPWMTVKAFAAGTSHTFEVKTIAPVRWLGTGEVDVRLVIVRPLAYRPRKGAKLLYRNPVYLVCTDPHLSLERLLQSYVWRWEVEVNFRDEKTVLGVGQAQVRTRTAVETVPAFVVAAYAFLLLAGTSPVREKLHLPQPKWQKSTPLGRETTAKMIGRLRAQLWGKAMGINLQYFVNKSAKDTKPVLLENSLPAAVCYAFK